MRLIVTGATGFIGGEVARLLRERGDDVRALVRTPGKAAGLRDLGCELVVGDLSDEAALTKACQDCDALIHAAASYEIGIRPDQRPAMSDVNVGGTERVLGAALSAGVRRAVYLSSVVVFGNTAGAIADEQWVRPEPASYTSVYEETKVRAHRRAQEIAQAGLPLVVVQPGVVYGPGDHSEVGGLVDRFLGGKLPLLPFPDLGVTPVHRDDVAAGVLAALETGAPGQSYVLGGEPVRMRDLIAVLAEVSGRRPPRGAVPTALLRAMAPLGGVVGPLLGFPPNLREVITSSDGVTFWASSDKAAADLGWKARPLDQGLRDLLAAR